MLLGILFTCITLWYVFTTPYDSMYKQHIYAVLLMIIYILLYLNTPFVQGEYEPINRYIYVFTLYPPIAYFMILFPHSVLLPLDKFFPDLPDYLAQRAMIVLGYIGLIFLLLILLGIKFLNG